MSRIRHHLTYANVMATIAVLLTMGGASYAAIALPSNSVGTRQLRNGAVTSAKLSRALRRRVFARRAFHLVRGPGGPVGSRGPQGPHGTAGIAGSAVAFARIGPGGGISQTKNVSGVAVINGNGSVVYTQSALVTRRSTPRSGGGFAVAPFTYCLQVRVPVSNVVVTPDAVYDTSAQPPDLAGAVGAIPSCPAGYTSASVTVRGRNPSQATGVADFEAAFFVALN